VSGVARSMVVGFALASRWKENLDQAHFVVVLGTPVLHQRGRME
jgi:hypothetical protein